MSADVIYTIAYVHEDATAIYRWCIVTFGLIFSFKSVACYGQHVIGIVVLRNVSHVSNTSRPLELLTIILISSSFGLRCLMLRLAIWIPLFKNFDLVPEFSFVDDNWGEWLELYSESDTLSWDLFTVLLSVFVDKGFTFVNGFKLLDSCCFTLSVGESPNKRLSEHALASPQHNLLHSLQTLLSIW